MKRKIFITGASGTGKTTLAKHISELYGIPFISTSAKEIWPKFGFKSHAEAHEASTKDINVGINYQLGVLKQRYDKTCHLESFVTDRSPVDNLAYILLQLGHKISDIQMDNFITTLEMQIAKSDGLIFIRWDNKVLDNGYHDGYRISNWRYQLMVDSILLGLIMNNETFSSIPILVLDTWDIETRIKQIDLWVKKL